MRCTAVAALMMVALTGPASAQMVDDPCPSGVVRWAVNSRMVQGRLMAPPVAGRPLTVAQAGMPGTRELPRDTPSLACRMRTSHKGKSALVGLGIGAAVGGVWGYSGGNDTGWCFFLCSAGSKAAFGAISLGAIGAAVGAIAGNGAQWSALRPDAGSRGVGLTLSAQRVGVRLGF